MKPGEFNLCILNKDTLQIKETAFKKNKIYRVSVDDNGKGVLVYGEWLTIQRFEANFIPLIPFLHEKLKALDLIIEGKAVSFKTFNDKSNMQIFGRGVSKLKVVYVGSPKENLFAFYPMTDTNIMVLRECYLMYVRLVNGEWEDLDNSDIVWGNSGYPLQYQRIYMR